MRERLAEIDLEVVRAERPKFDGALVLLHGLWTGPWIWTRFTGYLAHRGWTSYQMSVRDLYAKDSVGMVETIEGFLGALGIPAIVVGHDLGGLFALSLGRPRAAVALAPLPSGATLAGHPAINSWRSWIQRRLGQPLRPGAHTAAAVLGVPRGAAVVGESAGAIGRLAALPRPAPRHDVPRLVVAGGHDPCGRPVELERLAAEIGADYQCHPDADHALPFGPLWETVAAGVHRWLIRTLGESLLLLRGDEDLREE